MATEAVGVGNQAAEDLRLSRQRQAEQDSFEAWVRHRIAGENVTIHFGGEQQTDRDSFLAAIGGILWESRLNRAEFCMAIESGEFRECEEFGVIRMQFLHDVARVAGLEWGTVAQGSLLALINAAADKLQAVGEPQPPEAAKVEPAAVETLGNVNARMYATLGTNPESQGWSAQQWATHLDCSKSSVAEADAWQSLKVVKASAKIGARAVPADRRRKTK